MVSAGRLAIALARRCRPAIIAGMPASTLPRLWATSDLETAIARVAPDILALLADGMPRNKTTIVAALADRHPKDDVRRTLMRLAVTERLVEKGGKYTLPAGEAGQG
jgi:hypothetical protein